jgi:hypothetical protein
MKLLKVFCNISRYKTGIKMNKSILWKNFKYTQTNITENMRIKFYRAITLYERMEKHSPDYISGFMAGANLDSQSREFITFINECVNSIPQT